MVETCAVCNILAIMSKTKGTVVVFFVLFSVLFFVVVVCFYNIC